METGSNWDKISGQWKQFSGQVKKQWGKLTDDELMEVNGNREILAGKVQERYGIAKEEANKQIDEWADKLKV
ncbi:MAG: CsbD family protein [Chloroflexi bacterium]|nr:CsbD family protein [Chloroflexota bacterium]